MPFLSDDVLDGGLDVLDTATTTLHICSQEPTTLAEANSTYTLGNKTSLEYRGTSGSYWGRARSDYCIIFGWQRHCGWNSDSLRNN